MDSYLAKKLFFVKGLLHRRAPFSSNLASFSSDELILTGLNCAEHINSVKYQYSRHKGHWIQALVVVTGLCSGAPLHYDTATINGIFSLGTHHVICTSFLKFLQLLATLGSLLRYHCHAGNFGHNACSSMLIRHALRRAAIATYTVLRRSTLLRRRIRDRRWCPVPCPYPW